MTNYDVYFGTENRALDSLSMLLEYPNHPRLEVHDFQNEVHSTGVSEWIKAECTNPRWYAGEAPIKKCRACGNIK